MFLTLNIIVFKLDLVIDTSSIMIESRVKWVDAKQKSNATVGANIINSANQGISYIKEGRKMQGQRMFTISNKLLFKSMYSYVLNSRIFDSSILLEV